MDPTQYARYADERARPFLDLLARIRHERPRRVIDLGCGPGNLTALLAQRWPHAAIEGIDSSPQMIDSAVAADWPGVRFAVGDVAEWQAPEDADVLVSNATLQWVPRHQQLMWQWARALPPDGWIGIQVPGNFDSPSHTIMRSLAATPRWRESLRDVLRHHDAVGTPATYAALLLDAGLRVDVWETTYLHVLPGDDPVLEWVRGTGLRPVLGALSTSDAAEFEAEYGAALRAAYPSGPHGTVFPFRRIFAVAHRPPS